VIADDTSRNKSRAIDLPGRCVFIPARTVRGQTARPNLQGSLAHSMATRLAQRHGNRQDNGEQHGEHPLVFGRLGSPVDRPAVPVGFFGTNCAATNWKLKPWPSKPLRRRVRFDAALKAGLWETSSDEIRGGRSKYHNRNRSRSSRIFAWHHSAKRREPARPQVQSWIWGRFARWWRHKASVVGGWQVDAGPEGSAAEQSA